MEIRLVHLPQVPGSNPPWRCLILARRCFSAVTAQKSKTTFQWPKRFFFGNALAQRHFSATREDSHSRKLRKTAPHKKNRWEPTPWLGPVRHQAAEPKSHRAFQQRWRRQHAAAKKLGKKRGVWCAGGGERWCLKGPYSDLTQYSPLIPNVRSQFRGDVG